MPRQSMLCAIACPCRLKEAPYAGKAAQVVRQPPTLRARRRLVAGWSSATELTPRINARQGAGGNQPGRPSLRRLSQATSPCYAQCASSIDQLNHGLDVMAAALRASLTMQDSAEATEARIQAQQCGRTQRNGTSRAGDAALAATRV